MAKADENAAKLAAPAERLRALLQAPNKKEAARVVVPPSFLPPPPPPLTPATHARPIPASAAPQILALVAANQVDGPLLLLLEQNIAGAQQAGQQEAAAFMEKIRLKLAQYAIESRAAAAGAAAEPKA